ncbi:MAG: phospholipase D-like domain-containing protein [Verrucomicrobiota bacterium]
MKTIFLLLLGALIGIALLPYLLVRQPEMPKGTNLRSPAFPFDYAELLIDRTRWDEVQGEFLLDHEIFDTVLREIRDAETFVLVDFFLWNPWKGKIDGSGNMRALSTRLSDALISKRIQNPDMPILVITDPINRIYGELAPELFDRMASYEIPIIFTDLDRLPDSNLVYAPQARFWGKFFGSDQQELAKRRLPNPFDPEGEKLTFSELGRLLFFKANHRKIVIAGQRNRAPRLIISSLNPADGSANHSNLGALIQGPVANFAAESELEIAQWSSAEIDNIHEKKAVAAGKAISEIRGFLQRSVNRSSLVQGQPSVTYLSEGAIRAEIVQQLERSDSGAKIDIGLFYFSDRKVIKALTKAIRRGVEVRVLLDANQDAFGREKNGIPNRIVAAELMDLINDGKIEVRWAATHGEQFHSKVMRIRSLQQDVLLLGSANWTRRNLANLNLEANVIFENASRVGTDFDAYFEKVWTNSEGYFESLPYSDWAESGWSLRWKSWLYRFQEWSGASTF